MAYLKEDGSLDVERINKLPMQEYMKVMDDLSEERYNEYISHLPINESKRCTKVLQVNYTIETDGVDMNDVIKYLRNICKEE